MPTSQHPLPAHIPSMSEALYVHDRPPTVSDLLALVLLDRPSCLLDLFSSRLFTSAPKLPSAQTALSKVLIGLAELRILAEGGNSSAYLLLMGAVNCAIAELDLCTAKQSKLAATIAPLCMTWPVRMGTIAAEVEAQRRKLGEMKLGRAAYEEGVSVSNRYDVIAHVLALHIWLVKNWPTGSVLGSPAAASEIACRKLPNLVSNTADEWWEVGRPLLRECLDEHLACPFPEFEALRRSNKPVKDTAIDRVHKAFRDVARIWPKLERAMPTLVYSPKKPDAAPTAKSATKSMRKPGGRQPTRDGA